MPEKMICASTEMLYMSWLPPRTTRAMYSGSLRPTRKTRSNTIHAWPGSRVERDIATRYATNKQIEVHVKKARTRICGVS
eukprot:scaffold92418_cov32-Tisochrysis_lutea.AAC.2